MQTVGENHCIIGVDIGTSSTKVTAFTEKGEVLCNSQEMYSLIQPQPGYAEQDPEAITEAAIRCIGQVCRSLGDSVKIEGIAFSSAMHGIMAIDENGKPLTNVITWADTRSMEEMTDIRNSKDAHSLYMATGVPIHTMLPLCKLRWLNKHQPSLMAKAAIFAGIKEFIIYRLTGRWVMDYSIASATGLFNIHQSDWHLPALGWAGIRRDQLPVPVSTMERIEGLDHFFADDWGIPADCPLIAGASDGCLANLGSGAMEPGQLALTVGTSGAVRMTVREHHPDINGRTFSYVLMPGYQVIGGPVNNGGILLKWFTEEILGKTFKGAEDFNWFLEEAAKVPPGADGLICIPYFMGERAPVWNPAVKGLFHGIQLTHNRRHLMRAMVEGICFSLYQIAEILALHAGPYTHILASGGFTQSDLWVQWLADIFGCRVHVAQDSDASATGAAMLGWLALGRAKEWEDFRSWIGSRKIFEPGMDLHLTYKKIYTEFAELAAWEDQRNR